MENKNTEDDVIIWKSLMIAATLTLLFYIFVLVYTAGK